MGFDFVNRAEKVVKITEIKWTARINYKPLRKTDFPKEEKRKKEKYTTWLPREVAELLNLKTALCKKCQTSCSSSHLKDCHNIEIPSNDRIIESMEHDSKLLYELKVTDKNKILHKLGENLKIHIDKIKTLLM